MQLKTKLLLTQLMLQNLISLIQAGNQETKEMLVLTQNAIGILLNLIIFCLIYAKQKEDIINIVVQFQIIIQLEIIFYNVQSINNYFLLIYLLTIENILRNSNKCYQILTHLLYLYIFLRMMIQFYSLFALFEFILFVLWQPLNHTLLHLEKQPLEKNTTSPNTPPQKQANPIAHLSYGDQVQQDLLEEKSPHPEKNANVALDEDLLNCLPYGLALIDKNYHVLHHNKKLLHYLMVQSTDQIVNSLDQLLSKQIFPVFIQR
ncbi:unnamed protein product (macronuclear) [Paramecium tetraurelia]|uniref:PAS domain-containing protein n=1 Tax=Paramecium tetraurelia TaxID=5888 RepID=A0EEC9_PARTE|nr:uncharacterized protein GSPATT00025992001 [Paramecium tetraurelia]CAK93647.1 unnamed protein product [Paramecium tetraurelia]|eukprot:XP_001461043.1 hypothetical protein (macronuclear) [Paramecium tetraurelia strain d4-2]